MTIKKNYHLNKNYKTLNYYFYYFPYILFDSNLKYNHAGYFLRQKVDATVKSLILIVKFT